MQRWAGAHTVVGGGSDPAAEIEAGARAGRKADARLRELTGSWKSHHTGPYGYIFFSTGMCIKAGISHPERTFSAFTEILVSDIYVIFCIDC